MISHKSNCSLIGNFELRSVQEPLARAPSLRARRLRQHRFGTWALIWAGSALLSFSFSQEAKAEEPQEPDKTATQDLGAPRQEGEAKEKKPERMILGASAPAQTTSSGVDVGAGWSLKYHGFFRAPFRVGIGARDPEQRTGAIARDDAGNPTRILVPAGQNPAQFNPATAYSKTTYHSPLLPDDQVLSWQSTKHNQTDWAELFFTVGNPVAEGTVSIEGFNFTQASYANADAQFGIAQGYVTLNPVMPWQNFRFQARAGAHWNRYGMAGRYDAGEYDTYLYGRTRITGITLKEELDVGGVSLGFEQGFGGHRPHPSTYNTAKFTLLAHGHAYLNYKGLMLGLHLLHSWAQEEDRDGQGCAGPSGINTSTGLPTINGVCAINWAGGATNGNGIKYPVGSVAGFGKFADGADGNVWLPDGHLTIFGPEMKWDAGGFGLLYLGYSVMKAKNALVVGPAVEVLHSSGGGEFALGVTNNYLDNPQCNPAKGECSSGGTGTVHSLLGQYELRLHDLIQTAKSGKRFWGDGWEVTGKLYGMFNQVNSDYSPARDGTYGAREPYGGVGVGAPAASSLARPNYWVGQGKDYFSSHSQLKFGGDLFANLTPLLGAGIRFDRVMPNNHLSGQSFSILSPRIELHSHWVTRERISLQYSRYFYAQRRCDLLSPYSQGAAVSGSTEYPYNGSPQNFTGLPASIDCTQTPSGPRLPDGWGATTLEAGVNTRGAPITGTNPNSTRPDENVIKLEASMWW